MGEVERARRVAWIARGGEAKLMDKRRGNTLKREIDTLFRLGSVAGMSDRQLLEWFASPAGADPGDRPGAEADREIAFESIKAGDPQPGHNVEVADDRDRCAGAAGLLAHDFGFAWPSPAPFDAPPELPAPSAPPRPGPR
jgi:hypothetical protein